MTADASKLFLQNKAGEFDGTEAAGGYLKVDLNPGGGRGGGRGDRGGRGGFGGGRGGGRGFGGGRGRDGGRGMIGAALCLPHIEILHWLHSFSLSNHAI